MAKSCIIEGIPCFSLRHLCYALILRIILFHCPTDSTEHYTHTIHSLQTECAYDQVFVYDGDIVLSPMKDSFSGHELQHLDKNS